MLIFRQLFDAQSSTYTYLLGDSVSREAILIDPVFEQVRRDAALIQRIESQAGVDARHACPRRSRDRCLAHEAALWQPIGLSAKSGATGADRVLEDGDQVAFGKRFVEARSTPGHTRRLREYVLDNQSMAFTGDCLLIRGSGRTDFQQGDPRRMFVRCASRFFHCRQPASCIPRMITAGIMVTSVDEERRYNPRLGGDIGIDDFAGYMNNLDLPHPKQIDVAVPANLKCGQPADAKTDNSDPQWAALTFTFGGIWEIQPKRSRKSSPRWKR